MSLTVKIYYIGKDGNARKFAEEMEQSGTAAKIRAEEGCLGYEYFLRLNDPETVVLLDSWEDRDAIERHHNSPMMKTIAELKKKYELESRLDLYMTDVNGTPESDRTYIGGESVPNTPNKILVAYFSTRGVTASKAKLIADACGGDLYEIKPAEPYTDEDLNYKNKESRSFRENQDKSIRPALADKDANVADYKTVFLGFPIWWYSIPSIVKTFLESYDFSGKTIILFATSDTTGFGKSGPDVQACVSDTAVVKVGKMLSRTAKFGVDAWVRELGLSKE